MCGDGGLGGGYEMSLFLAELNFICKSGKIKKKNEKTVIVWKVPPLDGMLYAVKLLTKNTSANILG